MAYRDSFSDASTASFRKYSWENRQQKTRKLADCRVYTGDYIKRQLTPRMPLPTRVAEDGWDVDVQAKCWNAHTAVNCLREGTRKNYSPRSQSDRARAHPGAISDWRGGAPLAPYGRNRASWLPDDMRSNLGGGPMQHPWRPENPPFPTESLLSPRLPQLSPRPMLSIAKANEGLAPWPAALGLRPAMPQPPAIAAPQPQISPRNQSKDMLTQSERLALIKSTRNMIDRHHRTMHQAFLAMDKERPGRI